MSVLNFQLSVSRKLLASPPALSPRGEEHTGCSCASLNKGSLNSDVAVILAAMVCAFICALGLNSALRCARCNTRRMAGDSSDGVAIRVANTGLKKAAMKTLPIVVYTSASKLPPGLATDCPICLAEFGDGEKVRVLPYCNHGFHMECIDKWLASHSSCPVCRHSLNFLSRNRKPRGAAVSQDTESNSAIQVVIEFTVSTQAIAQRIETLERIPEEATEVMTSSPLPPSSAFKNQAHVWTMSAELFIYRFIHMGWICIKNSSQVSDIRSPNFWLNRQCLEL